MGFLQTVFMNVSMSSMKLREFRTKTITNIYIFFEMQHFVEKKYLHMPIYKQHFFIENMCFTDVTYLTVSIHVRI